MGVAEDKDLDRASVWGAGSEGNLARSLGARRSVIMSDLGDLAAMVSSSVGVGEMVEETARSG